MFRTSGIREKLRSSKLEELAREKKGLKRRRLDEEESVTDDEDDETKSEAVERSEKRAQTSSALLAILPKPKHSTSFERTVKLDQMLRVPERAEAADLVRRDDEDSAAAGKMTDDGMVEFDVRKMVTDVDQTLIKDLTVEKARPTVIVPSGKEKQKNQITYLAKLGKANELERKEQASLNRLNKAAARSKYGW